MSDDTARRDAWRDASRATTVTGSKVQPEPAPREAIHEEHARSSSEATDPSNAATYRRPDGTVVVKDDRHGENVAAVTHPSNAAPPATAFTNTDGTTTEGEPVTFVPEDD
jgi:hypothetical protein